MKSASTAIFCLFLCQFLFAQVAGETNLPAGTNHDQLTVFQQDKSHLTDADFFLIQPATCRQQNGSITMASLGDNQDWQYSLDGNTFQSSRFFSNLGAGWYTIYILDESGVIQVRETEVPSRIDLTIDEISITPADCIHPTGSIRISPTGGYDSYTFSLADRNPQTDPVFQELADGIYSLRIADENGCTFDTTLVVLRNQCTVYIPNVFSPNGDGVNDLFQIRTAGDENMLITRFFIFDRWGNNVFKRYNLSLQSTEEWWDGTYKHFTSSAGIFNYYLEVQFENGERETFKGNVTLIR